MALWASGQGRGGFSGERRARPRPAPPGGGPRLRAATRAMISRATTGTSTAPAGRGRGHVRVRRFGQTRGVADTAGLKDLMTTRCKDVTHYLAVALYKFIWSCRPRRSSSAAASCSASLFPFGRRRSNI